MTDKIIIDDYKKTIKRLQQECMDKTDNIIALGEQLKIQNQSLRQENRQLREILNKILKEIEEIVND